MFRYALRKLALLVCWSACSSSSTTDNSGPIDVIRISSFSELGPITPSQGRGVSARLADLIYRPANEFYSAITVEGDAIRLTPRREGRMTVEALAQATHCRGVATFAWDSGVVLGKLAPGQPSPTLATIVVDAGPFEQESVSSSRMLLRRRAGSGIKRIEVVAMANEDEEWRRFLAREVDVVPAVSPSHLRYLAEVPSVRIVQISERQTACLQFNVSASPFSDVRLRRAVSLGLRRRALAQSVAGSPDTALDVPESSEEARTLLRAVGPTPPIRVLLYSAMNDAQRVALVIRQQLAELGVSTTIRLADLDAAEATVLKTRDFDILLLYCGFEPQYFRRALSGSPGNITGYNNAEFDAAVQAGENRRAIELLQRDLPFTPLYRIDEGVAVSRNFCGVHPKNGFDLSWLAEVRACAPGELE